MYTPGNYNPNTAMGDIFVANRHNSIDNLLFDKTISTTGRYNNKQD